MTQIKALLEKFDALNERERGSIFMLFIVAIIFAFAEFVILPLDQENANADKKVVVAEQKVRRLKNEIILLKAKSKKRKEITLKQKQALKLNLVNEQLENLDLRLKKNLHGLVQPKEMAKVLEVVLSQNTGLKLLSMKSLESKPLIPTNIDGKAEDFGIYHHGIIIKLKGSYLGTLSYLKAIEDLPWNFYWDILELNMSKYPVASVVIEVHTLSFHKDWIGV